MPAITLTPQQARTAQAAFALLQRGDAAQALRLATRLASEAAASADSQHVLALCLAACGRDAEAEQAFARALACAPEHPLVLRNLATFHRRAGRSAAAADCFERAARAQPGVAQNWADCGLSALDAGDPGRAVSVLAQALAHLPDSALLWQASGCAAREAGDDEAAERAFARCAELEPERAAHWVNLGIARRRLGRPDAALACLARAAALGLEGPALRDAEIGCLLDAGQVEAALALARSAVDRWPEDVAVQQTLAHLLWEYTDEPPFAAIDAALRHRPGHGALRYAHAQLLLQANRAEDALAAITGLPDRDALPTRLLEAEALAMLARDTEADALLDRLWQEGHRHAAQLNLHARHSLKRADPQRTLALTETLLAQHRYDQEALAYHATALRLLGDPREMWLCDYDRYTTIRPVAAGDGTLPDGWLTDLAVALEQLHRARREPIRQSLRHGSQTPGRLFGRDDPLLRGVAAALRAECERWLATLEADPQHPFLARLGGGVRYAGSWSVRLRASGYHANHIHGQGWLSSAFYVQLPPSMREDREDGCLRLGQPPAELGLDLEPRRLIRPRVGHLALFPSYCWHGTVPFDGPTPRITIAFDLLPAPAGS